MVFGTKCAGFCAALAGNPRGFLGVFESCPRHLLNPRARAMRPWGFWFGDMYQIDCLKRRRNPDRMVRSFAALLVAIFSLTTLAIAHEPTAGPTCALSLELVDAQTGEPLPGIVQLRDAEGRGVQIEELVNRGQGIRGQKPIHDWWVLPRRTTIHVPAAPLTVHAISGLETETATEQIDLTGQRRAELSLRLPRFYRARPRGYLAGNTHLHLMKLSKLQADRYLREVPTVDGLEIVFVSYLERAKADLEYTSNNYSRRELERLSHGHLHFGHGQEHRHNFGSHGEGYGHILLLDIPYVVHPVSIGPGITEQGVDAPPLQQGIDKARSLGGKVIWAHNLFGFEDIPNWLTGRVHANNIYDGSPKGSFKDTYYRYLNVGLRVPFSTGTDWFIYDFSRVYVMSDRAITPTEWLDRLAAGRSYITNGPLLELTVDGEPLGSELKLDGPRTVTVRGRGLGRSDFERIELVRNGRVVERAPSRQEGRHFAADMDVEVQIDEPSWIALRTVPPPVSGDAELQEPVAENEFGGRLFSHTSPIYLQLAGRDVFDLPTARGLLAEMKADWKKIEEQAAFDDDHQRRHVQAVYQEAIEVLSKRIDQAGQ